MSLIDQKVLKGAMDIIHALKKAGFDTYFAGGYARDYLLKLPSLDIDIATNASVEEISNLFPKCYFVGANFGVVQVVVDGVSYEVATFRMDQGSLDGRRPQSVKPANSEMDAQRRDFTINGMFFDPIEKKIIDYVGGKKDIEDKLIRAIGDPEKRFEEDRLRMIRAVRFAVRFGFEMERETKNAIQKWANQLFPSVSWERIVEELKKMNAVKNFAKALILLEEVLLLKQIFPAELKMEKIKKLSIHIPLVLKLTIALAMPFDQKLNQFLVMKMSNKEIKLAELYRNIEDAIQSADQVKLVRSLASEHSKVCIKAYFELYPEKQSALLPMFAHLQPFVQRVATNNPVVSAQDLKTLGVKEGPILGALLKEAEKIAILENLQDKERVIEKCTRLKIWPI